jgi:hypothetical protein
MTDDHLLAFGAITYRYAYAEAHIKNILAHSVGIPIALLATLVEPCSSLELRNVAKSTAKLVEIDETNRERFCWLIGQLGSFGPLRNNIAHRRWTPGRRPGSIKPVAIDIRSGSAKMIGIRDDERDWTTDELFNDANRLHWIGEELYELVRKAFPDIADTMESSNSEMDSSDGNSTNDS